MEDMADTITDMEIRTAVVTIMDTEVTAAAV